MNTQQQIMREIKDLPAGAQVKILKFIHFMKMELFPMKREKKNQEGIHAMEEVDGFAMETGVPDLSRHHDYYLYGVPKE